MSNIDKKYLVNPKDSVEILISENRDNAELRFVGILKMDKYAREVVKENYFDRHFICTEQELIEKMCDGDFEEGFVLRDLEEAKGVIDHPCYCDTFDAGILGHVEEDPTKIGYYYFGATYHYNYMYYDKLTNNILIIGYILDHEGVPESKELVYLTDVPELQNEHIDFVINATLETTSKKIKSRLTQYKNQVIYWNNIAMAGVTSDVEIYNHENPEELLKYKPYELLTLLRADILDKAQGLKAFEYKDGEVISLIENTQKH